MRNKHQYFAGGRAELQILRFEKYVSQMRNTNTNTCTNTNSKYKNSNTKRREYIGGPNSCGWENPHFSQSVLETYLPNWTRPMPKRSSDEYACASPKKRGLKLTLNREAASQINVAPQVLCKSHERFLDSHKYC